MKSLIISIFSIALFLSASFSPILGESAYNNQGFLENLHTSSATVLLDEEPFEGYTLYSPEFSIYTYLINIDGEVVHGWSSNYMQAMATYLFENGNILRTCLPGVNPRFVAGGISGRAEIFDWDGNLVWEFEYFNNQHCMHHDAEIMPNGNILFIAWEYKSREEVIAAGRNPSQLPEGELWPDHIIEVEPSGSNGATIVWEWHVWDHLIQDFDASKDNYGVVEDHPELVDINCGNPRADWNHINSVDYNEELDQILLSSHNQHEIWVIDHSTTTEEAAGHTGGRYGKGGDILYRWGNPEIYGAGNSNDKMLFGQHDAQWIEEGCPGEGNILIFNNGQSRPNGKYASIDEIIPPIDNNGSYIYVPGESYGPDNLHWSYTADNPTDFMASHISGCQRLPNGNTLICNGPLGYFFEVTYDKDIVWQYQNPTPAIGNKNVFKIRRYAPDYPGLADLFDNNVPNIPTKPVGPSSGNTESIYTYISSSTDPDDDDLLYLFDWGDGTDSGWLGPFKNGVSVNASHRWENDGDYEIRVKAKDPFNAESNWSDPLVISMPKQKNNVYDFFEVFAKYWFEFIDSIMKNH